MSLAGASAALRYIDDHQKRAGTVTVLVARGLADAVPSPPALPVTVSPPMTSAPPATVRDTEVKKYKGDDDCGAKPGDFEVEAFRLDGAHAGVSTRGLWYRCL